MKAVSKGGLRGGFGVRYGLKNVKKYAAIARNQKRVLVCAKCDYPALRRICAGIWACKKCRIKIAGGAYSL